MIVSTERFQSDFLPFECLLEVRRELSGWAPVQRASPSHPGSTQQGRERKSSELNVGLWSRVALVISSLINTLDSVLSDWQISFP